MKSGKMKPDTMSPGIEDSVQSHMAFEMHHVGNKGPCKVEQEEHQMEGQEKTGLVPGAVHEWWKFGKVLESR